MLGRSELRRLRLGKGGGDVGGQARPRVSEQEEALAAEKADAAMAALLAEESGASKDGTVGAASGSQSGKAAGKDKGGGGKKKKRAVLKVTGPCEDEQGWMTPHSWSWHARMAAPMTG